MLKRGLFSIIFKVDNVEFQEEYNLAYRTEEKRVENSTLYQQAKAAIAKDLSVYRCCVNIIKIMKIHNDLIVEEYK